MYEYDFNLALSNSLKFSLMTLFIRHIFQLLNEILHYRHNITPVLSQEPS